MKIVLLKFVSFIVKDDKIPTLREKSIFISYGYCHLRHEICLKCLCVMPSNLRNNNLRFTTDKPTGLMAQRCQCCLVAMVQPWSPAGSSGSCTAWKPHGTHQRQQCNLRVTLDLLLAAAKLLSHTGSSTVDTQCRCPMRHAAGNSTQEMDSAAASPPVLTPHLPLPLWCRVFLQPHPASSGPPAPPPST